MARQILNPLHRLWRALPRNARRGAFSRITAALAPRPDQPVPKVSGGFIVGGELSRASGLGEGARLMLAALRHGGLSAWPLEAGLPVPGESGPAHEPLRAAPGAALILHVNPPVLAASLLRLPRGFVRGRRIIGYWAWELPVAAPGWHRGVKLVHDIWVPSRFTAAALEPLAPGQIRVVPHPVAVSPPVPSTLTRADFGLDPDAVVVLVSFSLASSFERKNPIAAITAFRAAFGNRPDRVLVLKLAHAHHAPEDFARLRGHCAGASNIMLETRVLPTADSHALTRCADIVLSLHRSEGFGLVPAEAMCLGRAIVATDYSGTAEFLDAACSIPIGYTLIPASDPRGVFEAPGAVWADASIAQTVDALRLLAGDAGLRHRLGTAAAHLAPSRLGMTGLSTAIAALNGDLPA